jgi:phage nucleotide-binding protein
MIDATNATLTPGTEGVLRPRTIAGLPVRSASEVRMTKGRNITIMAKAGMGKTTLTASALESRFAVPILHLDIDGSSHVLDDDNNLDIVQVGDWAKFKKAFDEIKRDYRKEGYPYKLISIDNMTELAYQNFQVAKLRGYKDIRQAYRDVTDDIMDVTHQLRDISVNSMVNVIMHVWIEKQIDPEENVNMYMVQFSPALQKAFPGVVDMIGHLTMESDKPTFTRKLSFIPLRSDAKFRRARTEINAQKIPLEMWNPNLGAVLDTLIGGDDFDSTTLCQATQGSQG